MNDRTANYSQALEEGEIDKLVAEASSHRRVFQNKNKKISNSLFSLWRLKRSFCGSDTHLENVSDL